MKGFAQLPGDAQQLVFVLVADAERDWHRHDAAQHAGPERIEELLVVGEVEDELVARFRAQRLQVVQDAERALVEFVVADDAFIALAFEITDDALDTTVLVDQLGQRFSICHHRRRSSFIMRG